MSEDLLHTLSDALAITFIPPENLLGTDRSPETKVNALTVPQQKQLTEMIRTALSQGLLGELCPGTWSIADVKRYDEGNTAQAVIKVPLKLEFAAKWDSNEKLLREAAWLSSIASRQDLPENVRRLVPKVFALRRGEETHAYLMEVFPEPKYRTLARALFEEQTNDALCARMISAALDALFTAYDATLSGEHHPLLPDIRGIYIGRIRDRLFDKKTPDELKRIRDSRLILTSGDSSIETDSCSQMLDEIEHMWPQLETALTPRFVTMVFGDPHPGNIMIEADHTGVRNVRVIDPKEWGEGDYLFEIAKFLHYLEVTWLVEVQTPPPVELVDTHAGAIEVKYQLRFPTWVRHGRADALGRVNGLLRTWETRTARSGRSIQADPEWQARLSLGLASNLLGVAGSRYLTPNERCGPACRQIIFAEGIRALHEFVLSARRLAS